MRKALLRNLLQGRRLGRSLAEFVREQMQQHRAFHLLSAHRLLIQPSLRRLLCPQQQGLSVALGSGAGCAYHQSLGSEHNHQLQSQHAQRRLVP